MLLQLLLISAVSLSFGQNAGKNVTCDDCNVAVRFTGRSGKMKIFPKDAEDDRWLSIGWQKIEEVDEDGERDKDNFINSLASQDFEWSDPEVVEVGGVNATKISLTAVLGVGKGNDKTDVYFAVHSYFFENETEVPYGNETVSVSKDQLKFNIEIEGWPFKAASNQLRFGVDVESKGGNNSVNEEDVDKNATAKETRINVGPGFLDMADQVLIGDELKDVDSEVTSKNPRKVSLTWTFPAFPFDTKMVYDPTLGLFSKSGGGGADSGASGAWIVIAVVAVVAVLAAVGYIHISGRCGAKRAPQPKFALDQVDNHGEYQPPSEQQVNFEV